MSFALVQMDRADEWNPHPAFEAVSNKMVLQKVISA